MRPNEEYELASYFIGLLESLNFMYYERHPALQNALASLAKDEPK